MKALKFFALFVAVMATALTSCEKPSESNTEQTSSAAAIESLTLVSGDVSIDGFLSGTTVEIAYRLNQYDALKNATAEVVISEGATISPDPAVARDYTVEGGVSYTVTAEDGTTTATYKVSLVEAVAVIVPTQTWQTTVGTMGLPIYSRNNVGIAFSGANLVTYDGQVFSVTDGSKVGNVNVEGVDGASAAGFQFSSLTNDNNGVLIGAVGLDASGNFATSGTTQCRFYAWKDGYASKPTLIHSSTDSDFSIYMNVSGDVNGDAILTYVAGRSAEQMHHVYVIKNGNWDNKAWTSVNTGLPGNDGNWGQRLSFFDGSNDGSTYTSPFIICDSRGNNEGLQILYCEGSNSPVNIKGGVDAEYGGTDGYGNYSQGFAETLSIDGVNYIVAATSGWTQLYLSIQPVNNEDNFLLPTTILTGAEVVHSAAAYYDAAAGVAYVASLSPNNQVTFYTISVQYV